MKEIENLKNAILKEYPRLSRDSNFTFNCHKGVPCFNDCCGDVNIFLTPYDIIRLKKRLNITSGEFLRKYTICPFDENLKYPVLLLKMEDDEKKHCPFVGPDGCGVYADRPWPCRMYPLGMASPGGGNEQSEKEFFFILKEAVCRGFEQDKKWTVSEWLSDQGIDEYYAMGEGFKELTSHRFFQEKGNLTPEKVDMFFTACYDLDQFRTFLFESSFFDKFNVDETVKSEIKTDDVELMNFGFQWLRFALFGEKTMSVKREILQKKEKELAAKIKK